MIDTELMTVQEIAHEFRQGEDTIRKWAKEGRFPCCRPGKRLLIKRSDYQTFMERSRVAINTDADVQAILRGLFGKMKKAS